MQQPPFDHVVTTALPYANNHLHLGHMLEQIQADIWVRYLKLSGKRVLFISAADGHGTAIMLQAQREGQSPESMIENYRASHQEDARDFGIAFDRYDSTHRAYAQEEVVAIYQDLMQSGAIFHQEVEQLYDHALGLFLPDRLVKGRCPRCQAPEQYGDCCESCGATYESHELIQPISSLSKTRPTLERSMHLFFNLRNTQPFLRHFIEHELECHSAVRSKLREWMHEGLKAWDISRDKPYFGFEIPDEAGKYFYVWVDAPIGYIATVRAHCHESEIPEIFPWTTTSQTEITHFLGKDIVYFHGLFWPAMLKSSGRKQPKRLCVHGHVTLNGRKMSKSRGNFLFARDFKQHLPTEALRYYFASRLQEGIEDLDLSLSDLITKFNSDVINKWLNLASRSVKILELEFDLKLRFQTSEPSLFRQALQQWPSLQKDFENRNFAQAVRRLMEWADEANRFFNEEQPWTRARHPETAPQAQRVCTEALLLFLLMSIGLKPIVPQLVSKIEAWLGWELNLEALQRWDGAQLSPYPCMASRLNLKEHEAWISAFEIPLPKGGA